MTSKLTQIHFWGTRGSLPVTLNIADIRQRLSHALKKARNLDFKSQLDIDLFIESLPFNVGATYGGATCCVEIIHDSPEHVICDMGSGALPMGEAKILRYGRPQPQKYHIFISHLHWDHLLGFPYFEPMYIPGNQIIIHGCHQRLEEAFRLQMRSPCFPIDYSQIGATVHFDLMVPGEVKTIAGLDVLPCLQPHPGDSYGYRFSSGDKTVVYSTDAEYPFEPCPQQDRAIELFREADIVIFDAQFTPVEAMDSHANWGHSCNILGAELCLAAKAKQLILFHHNPYNDDLQLARMLDDTVRFVELSAKSDLLNVISAYDGLIVDI